MRVVISFALVLAAACGSAATPGGIAPTPRTTTIDAGGAQITIHSAGDEVTGYAIAARADQAWNALPGVFRAIGLSVTQIDPAAHTVRGQRLRSVQYLMGKPLSDYLDCGTTAGVPNVGRYPVDMEVATQLVAQGDSTLVRTVVSANAKPSGTAGDPFRCEPNQKIAASVAQALAKAAVGP